MEINQIKKILENLKIKKYEITSDGVNVYESVIIPYNYASIPLQFNYISDSFSCDNTMIISLKGSPKYVSGDFSCSNTKINSLKYAPREVGHNFYCSYTNITSLKYAPREVGGLLFCHNTKINGKPYLPKIILVDELIWL